MINKRKCYSKELNEATLRVELLIEWRGEEGVVDNSNNFSAVDSSVP